MKKSITNCLAAGLVLVHVPTSSAATVLSENFVGVSKGPGSPIATIDAWDTVNGVVTSGNNVTITNTTEPGSGINYEDAQASALDVDYRVWNGGDSWTITFDSFALDGATQAITPDTFDFNSFATNGAGAFRTGTNTTINWTIELTGDGGYSESASTDVAYTQGGSFVTQPGSISLAGWADLVQGENYTIEITSLGTFIGDSTYSALDDISLVGDITPIAAIPEPSSSILLGLAGLSACLVRRRR